MTDKNVISLKEYRSQSEKYPSITPEQIQEWKSLSQREREKIRGIEGYAAAKKISLKSAKYYLSESGVRKFVESALSEKNWPSINANQIVEWKSFSQEKRNSMSIRDYATFRQIKYRSAKEHLNVYGASEAGERALQYNAIFGTLKKLTAGRKNRTQENLKKTNEAKADVKQKSINYNNSTISSSDSIPNPTGEPISIIKSSPSTTKDPISYWKQFAQDKLKQLNETKATTEQRRVNDNNATASSSNNTPNPTNEPTPIVENSPSSTQDFISYWEKFAQEKLKRLNEAKADTDGKTNK